MDKCLLRITEERGNAKTKAPLFHSSFFFMLNQDKRRNKEEIICAYERECMVNLI
ncbi:MAG: hypothetical protein WA977_05205 [Halobacteriota archaeon]